MISITCSPVLVFYRVSVDNTKNLRDGVSALAEISLTSLQMEVSVLHWLHEFILVHHSCLVLAVVSGMGCGTADGLQKRLVKDPRMIVVLRCLVKLSVWCSNTVVPAQYLLLRLKVVRLQLYERKEFCF